MSVLRLGCGWLRSVGLASANRCHILYIFTVVDAMAHEYIVTRLFKDGRLIPKHARTHIRGELVLREEHDEEHRRMTRVARLTVAASEAKEAPPPLFDAVWLAAVSDWQSVTGFERLRTGPLQDTQVFAQTWRLVYAPFEDLLRAERQIDALTAEVNELRARLAAARPTGIDITPDKRHRDV
jgi:hypothetical protein